jgi:GNAT superfamily N-acetyltransferase
MRKGPTNIAFETGCDATDFDRVTAWLAATYWSPGITKEEVVFGAKNSTLVVNGVDGDGVQVSYMRVVSDRVRFAYLMDVVVDPAIRKRGIGSAMVKFAMASKELSLVYQWLLRTSDAHGVYAKLGFVTIDTPEEFMIVKKARGNRKKFRAE